jgi:hypothetical protein
MWIKKNKNEIRIIKLKNTIYTIILYSSFIVFMLISSDKGCGSKYSPSHAGLSWNEIVLSLHKYIFLSIIISIPPALIIGFPFHEEYLCDKCYNKSNHKGRCKCGGKYQLKSFYHNEDNN